MTSNILNWIIFWGAGHRQAVVQLFDAVDLNKTYKDIPCTCTFQFLLRDGKLNMITNMRSNDAYWGLPHDIFSFTMLQEVLARSLNAEVGIYKHFVGSLHLYEPKVKLAKQFLKEGFQSRISMPPMPYGDPWLSLNTLLDLEKKIRLNENFQPEELDQIDSYWKDLVLLLLIFRCNKRKESTPNVNDYKKMISNESYKLYI